MTLIKWFVIIDINEFCIILTHVSVSYQISKILKSFSSMIIWLTHFHNYIFLNNSSLFIILISFW